MQNIKKSTLIGAASNLGIPNLNTSKSNGSEYAPYALKEDLKLNFDSIVDGKDVKDNNVKEYLKLLFDCIMKNTLDKSHLTVIGGDHSIGVATWQAMMKLHGDDIALIWIDAHLDANNFDTTPSGNTHGMPLATLLGHCQKLEFIEQFLNIKPQNLYLIGARDYEKEELELLNKLGVKIYFIDEVKNKSFKVVMDEVQLRIQNEGKKYGISLDLDYFDPSDIKAVNTSVSNGGNIDNVVQYFQNDLDKENLIAFELVEFNPSKDEKSETLKCIEQLLKAIC